MVKSLSEFFARRVAGSSGGTRRARSGGYTSAILEGTLAVFGKTEPNRVSTEGAASIPVPTTVLGRGARFVGDLSGDEDIVVNGRFEGKIRAEKSVTVGAGGELDGDIAARSVVVGGRVRGQILAGEKAELLESAIVEGSVQAPKIVIAEGALIEGNVAMSGAREGLEEK